MEGYTLMKNEIFLPVPLFWSALLACFLFGAIIGTVVTYSLIENTPKISQQDWIANLDNEQKAEVKEVIDGDTIVVSLPGNRSATVRYLGIDAPENKTGTEPNYYGHESLEKNKNLVLKKTVTLCWDKNTPRAESSNRARLLAYVYVGPLFVNAEMLRSGCAKIYLRSEKPIIHQYSVEFEQLEKEAKAEQRGIWNIKAQKQWEQDRILKTTKQPSQYVADDKYFHRPECPEANKISFKKYYAQREKALRDVKPCPVCKP